MIFISCDEDEGEGRIDEFRAEDRSYGKIERKTEISRVLYSMNHSGA